MCSEHASPNKVRLLADYLLPGRCLDLGSGSGVYGDVIVGRCRDLLQADLVDRRNPEAQRHPFKVIDASNLQLGGERFENVVAFDLLEHLPDEDRFLQQARELCSGRLLLSVPNEDDAQPAILGLTHRHHTDKTHCREYSRASLREVVERHGFSVLEIRPQINTLWAFNAPMALAKPNRISWLAAKSIYYQSRLYEAIGLFENRCIADWLCCAEIV